MHRLFVALRPPAAVRETLLDLMDGVTGARWQDDEQLHLTLAFIGEVERPAAEDIAVGLARVTRSRPTIALQGVGTFGRTGHPHSLWVGCRSDPMLGQLNLAVKRALRMAGCASDARAFHPHVTIARMGSGAGTVEPFLRRHAGLAIEPFEATAFYLFESMLGSGGATYSVIARYPLGR